MVEAASQCKYELQSIHILLENDAWLIFLTDFYSVQKKKRELQTFFFDASSVEKKNSNTIHSIHEVLGFRIRVQHFNSMLIKSVLQVT